MGAFYGNITLRGASRERVADVLRGRRALVADAFGDDTVAFDSVCDEQDIEGIQALASRISGEIRCVALAVIVHDDDVFGYFLYRDGGPVDWYNSCPGYFDSDGPLNAPAGGNVERLCEAFGVDKRQELEAVLRTGHGENGYVFETARHRDMINLLELPGIAVGNALASFDGGKRPKGLSAEQLLWAADAPPAGGR